MQIHGHTNGLSPSALGALERLERRKVPFDRLVTRELAKSLADFSHTSGRQVGVLVDRTGAVSWVVVGDANRLMLPDIGRLRGAAGRFRGLRLIHTHLRHEPLSRDDLVDLTRLRLDLICAICLSPEGQPQIVYYAHNLPPSKEAADPNIAPFRTFGPIPWGHLDVNPEQLVRGLEEEFARATQRFGQRAKDGRALLLHVCEKRDSKHAEASLRELRELARTAGMDVADAIIQLRERVDPKYVMGRGKIEDVVIRAMMLDAEVLVFDRDLTAGQAAAISRMTDLNILDRTQLILDVFAQRAESRAGRLQVELAQMHYLLPRLGQKDDALSRLTGGIGGRGPGETKLEVGRRRARERIDHLKAQQKKLVGQRNQQRKRRRSIHSVAIVGYTNAGKSTLLNTLTGSNVLSEDKLFATLDTRARRLWLSPGHEVVVADTVGFIRNLPKALFPAFKATFEEAEQASLLLQVVDASDPACESHLATTDSLLRELELHEIPRLLVWNKQDAADPNELRRGRQQHGGIAVAGAQKSTTRPLLTAIEGALWPASEAGAVTVG